MAPRHGGLPAPLPGIIFLLLLVTSGCAGGGAPATIPFAELNGLAAVDSLGLPEFRDLEPEERAARRREADRWLARAHDAPDLRSRVRALTTAAGLAPDEPTTWLELAAIWRWAGEYLNTEASLVAAAAAVRSPDETGRGDRDAAALATALLRAWFHYDRAEWNAGLAWSRLAMDMAPGDTDAMRIEGLLEAASGGRSQAHAIASDLRRQDEFTTDARWILAVLDRARDQNRAAFSLIQGLRPDRAHAAECWRDMAGIAEVMGHWAYARRWYAQSRATLPLDDTSNLRQVDHPRLGPPGQPEMPVWLAADRWVVTGSRSAATALAFARFEAAATDADRQWWGSAVVNQAGILLRRGEDQFWARRARGLVYARQGMIDRGLRDLRRVAGTLAAAGRTDARVEAGLGHLLLLREDHRQARTHLEQAVALAPGRAATWSDLGLALIMSGETTAAREALGRAITLDPQLATAWYNRGLMHLHAGQHDAAAADLAEAARLAPDNQEVARLLQQLATMGRQEGP